MRSPLTVTLAALASLTGVHAAVGSAKVVNKCDFAVSLWSVGSAVSEPVRLKAKTGTYAERFTRDPVTGGRVLKVTRPADGLWTGAPQTNFAFNLDGANIWYDLSDVFGDPFEGEKLVVASADNNCGKIVWEDGVPPGGSQVKVCTASKDVTFTLCA